MQFYVLQIDLPVNAIKLNKLLISNHLEDIVVVYEQIPTSQTAFCHYGPISSLCVVQVI